MTEVPCFERSRLFPGDWFYVLDGVVLASIEQQPPAARHRYRALVCGGIRRFVALADAKKWVRDEIARAGDWDSEMARFRELAPRLVPD